MNPAPFNAYLRLGDCSVLSSFLEHFLKLDKSHFIINEPIKGTRQKIIDKKENERIKVKLLKTEKYHSELIMIIDLICNDLDNINQKWSIQVKML
ncbi:MAG: chorismate-binding protein [Flavobacteriales bacterium AspAUS03]